MSSGESTSEPFGMGQPAGPPQSPHGSIPGDASDQVASVLLGAPTSPRSDGTDDVDLALLLRTLVAVKRGDFSARMPDEWTGTAGKIADTLNDVIDLNARLVQELQRISRLVGKEGKTNQRATLGDVGGSWAGYVDSLNSLVDDLVRPTDDMARVITAVAQGDLSQRMELEIDSRPLQGTFLRTAGTVNKMVDQLNSFASEVTRVAREVGTDGKLGGQADVKGVAGTWRDLTDSVNWMASNLTGQVRNIADVTTAVAKGDLTRKITVDARGEILELKNTINTMVDQLSSFASEVTRVATEVGTEGKLGGQADVRDVSGTWRDLTDSVNSMASNLTDQVRNIAEVTTSVATGDLSRKITVDARGEILELKNTINTMVDQLNSFASEVTRVAREVGTEGKLGGQAQVRGISGTWKDLTDNVNFMAANLTSQVRGIARVVTAVANGDLKQKLTVEAKGEIAQLSDTINAMIDTLATFAEQVTTVAREVGVDGRLGGQANVPGAAGTWRDLTDNVNRLAANLTTQVRAIAEVATAVTKGDLTRSIQVEASGEVAILKDNVNQMIANLRETTRVNSEQDWLKTNLARFTRMLQGQRDLMSVAKQILSELAPVVSAQQGVFYTLQTSEVVEPRLRLLASYAYRERKQLSNEFGLGEGLVGQCALEKDRILLTSVPSDYIHISSGLGEAPPVNIVVLPIVFEGQVKGVLELASFERFSPTHLAFLDQLVESIGIVLNTIEATSRTEDLLKQSQSLAAELQSQQEELQQTNEELEEKARLLVDQNAEVERKNAEVERSRQALEEKASQLALTSKYKSEFLSNMSHELRTPLNSLMILSQHLAENPDGNLTSRQVEFARTILSSGTDLLTLINDILDLSKVESGTVSLELGDLSFTELRDYVERSFRHIADGKGLQFAVDLDPSLPSSMYTDATRLQQILKNLLSNAFKFTDRGSVRLAISAAKEGWRRDSEALNRASSVIAFAVSDTGIGIPLEKHQLVFEAFQQADGTTSRKYGGTGLGLSISRELAKLLNGEIHLESVPGEGSIFTLYVPQNQPLEMARPRSPYGGYPGSGEAPYTGGLKDTDTEQWLRQPSPGPEAEPGVAAKLARIEPAMDTSSPPIVDDRNNIQPGDRVLVVIEDDPIFARVLLDLARAQGFKGVIALRGDSALALIQRFQPDAITLDIRLPDLNGWRIIDRLKDNPDTRHIPVHIISVEDEADRGLRKGALSYVTKPASKEALSSALASMRGFVDRKDRNLLVVEDDERQRNSIVELIGNGDVRVTAVASGEEALTTLKLGGIDCVVMDIGLPDMSGFDLIDRIRRDRALHTPPIIVYTGRDLTQSEASRLQKMADKVIVKDVRSPERLLDETALFLHRVASKLPANKRQMLEQLHRTDAVLSGKKVLIVDDDIRNAFALTSLLEHHGMEVLTADNGADALQTLRVTPDVDLVLMDIMMPEMDGYETTRAIRKMSRFRSIPIFALTAKAMKGDRKDCLEAGVSDYVAKPVDGEQLLSMLREWLYR